MTTSVASLPIARIDQLVRPTPEQRSRFDKLKEANASASKILQATCPPYATLTPTGRVAAMEQRLKAALEAVDTVAPALTDFYQSLTNEQKAHFDMIGS